MQGMTDTGTEARRKRARRTAMIAGGFAVAVFLLSIVQMLRV
ncbi:MAG: hypothetical protein AAGC76_16560 [Luteibacter sp.]|jgi:hypothetical protein|nr:MULTISPECIES: hypothetical protein [Rhodanobacteraceae]MDQ7997455.1 hypothetical protein [Luteibacter sp.]MDQ8048385.1 hypothetical protein [Luteibacter sp.]SDG64686.1 hypothetical protein SAMN04515659_3227 [Dyella sp. 333MFSha]SKB37632.1 hypothetical protein SAMN05660880_00778 [Luteibacter sp. 22Crub2.1]